jgi:hypothetical protein
VATVKNTVIWDVTPWTLVYRCHISKESAIVFRIKESYMLKKQPTGSSETLVSIYKIIRHHISEDSNLHRSSALKEFTYFAGLTFSLAQLCGQYNYIVT